MDLIATYYLFIITTSFLGLITAVWVGFRCKMAFFMGITTLVMVIREVLMVISGSVRGIINRLMVIRGTLRVITKPIRVISGAVMTISQTLRVIREVIMTITTPVMAIKIDVNHSNYGERLTLPIVFARTKTGFRL